MTIVNINYASLDEVFGSEFNKKKKKKPKKQQACNYYARRYEKTSDKDLSNVQSNDVINNFAGYGTNDYSPELTGKDNKYSKNNRNVQDKHKLYIDEEEEMDYFDKLYKTNEFKPLTSMDGNNLMNYTNNNNDDNNDDSDDEEPPQINREIQTTTYKKPFKSLLTGQKQEDNKIYEEDKHYLDFGLYLISGILLIFILEQFVQLGMIMKQKKVQEQLYVF
jgi:hypothetical protein|tara:strand:- start:28 stop:687 length:660 start_codon:yes stop_codon:yes gene_type:complete